MNFVAAVNLNLAWDIAAAVENLVRRVRLGEIGY